MIIFWWTDVCVEKICSYTWPEEMELLNEDSHVAGKSITGSGCTHFRHRQYHPKQQRLTHSHAHDNRDNRMISLSMCLIKGIEGGIKHSSIYWV